MKTVTPLQMVAYQFDLGIWHLDDGRETHAINFLCRIPSRVCPQLAASSARRGLCGRKACPHPLESHSRWIPRRVPLPWRADILDFPAWDRDAASFIEPVCAIMHPSIFFMPHELTALP